MLMKKMMLRKSGSFHEDPPSAQEARHMEEDLSTGEPDELPVEESEPNEVAWKSLLQLNPFISLIQLKVLTFLGNVNT